MIELKRIHKIIRNDDIEVRILQDITLKVSEGEFLAVMGPSGSGKSTLLNIIGFLDTVTSGEYRFKDQDVSGFDEDRLARLRSSDVGYVFQAFNLLPKTSVLDNVKMPLMYAAERRSERERTEIATKAIQSVGLSHRIGHLSNQLSGGEKQRVAIARALVNAPSVILADEPTGNLDSASGVQVMNILRQLNEQGKTVILVTHEQTTAEYAARIVRLKDGTVVSDERVLNRNHGERAALK